MKQLWDIHRYYLKNKKRSELDKKSAEDQEQYFYAEIANLNQVKSYILIFNPGSDSFNYILILFCTWLAACMYYLQHTKYFICSLMVCKKKLPIVAL